MTLISLGLKEGYERDRTAYNWLRRIQVVGGCTYNFYLKERDAGERK